MATRRADVIALIAAFVAVCAVWLMWIFFEGRRFFLAIEGRDAVALGAMLKRNPHLVRRTDQWGSTGLNIAVEKGDPQMVQLLIEAGSDLNHASGRTASPLQAASYFGHLPIVELLVDSGAQVNAQFPPGKSFIRGTALHAAASGGRAQVVKYLLEHGADVNMRSADNDQVTPLHSAITPAPESSERLEVVKLLLAHGADVRAKDQSGLTPLDDASQFEDNTPGFKPICELLRQHADR